ncbi:hypothetical protein HCU01_24190 [Halomonas cupida]|uniref:Uncharacterized protein n=1 Tax=Halomonas cupida TaxID=44933 RepID=A0ABQ0WFI4_9GAMM|nr:hypothetical protein HCU01_24190 [Halomonas cupida]
MNVAENAKKYDSHYRKNAGHWLVSSVKQKTFRQEKVDNANNEPSGRYGSDT